MKEVRRIRYTGNAEEFFLRMQKLLDEAGAKYVVTDGGELEARLRGNLFSLYDEGGRMTVSIANKDMDARIAISIGEIVELGNGMISIWNPDSPNTDMRIRL